MIIETGMQQYCLRWNNHKTNLLTVFGELFRNEDFTDVTIACENGSFIKCHRMVLAASSSYFQSLFSELPYRNPVIVLKDVRYVEIQAILEYMYKGEVSVTMDEVAPLLKVAEALKVKGLVGDSGLRDECGAISTSSPSYGLTGNHRSASPSDLSKNASTSTHQNESGSSDSSVNNTSVLSGGNKIGESHENVSPPHSTVMHQHQQAIHRAYYARTAANRLSWPTGQIVVPPSNSHPSSSVLCNNYYDGISEVPIVPSARKKKPSGGSLNLNRDTPILRTVLGQHQQGQPDSSQPMSLVLHNSDGQEQPQSNGPTTPQDGSYGRMRSESSHGDAHSPYMDTAFIDEECQERGSKVMHSSSSSPQSLYSDAKGGVSAGIASYVPNQKPEWKRYKQYTRTDIMSAIDAVRHGMSALQAARKYGVPSRTLYDKVKKLGITTSRPFRRSNGSNGAAFPFGLSGTGGAMYGLANEDEPSQGATTEPGFLQQALESSSGKVKMDNVDRDALSTSSPPPVPPNTLLLQRALEVDDRVKSDRDMVVDREAMCSTPGDNSGQSSGSPPPSERPAPTNLIKYSAPSQERSEEYDDVVEDLSMTRKPEPQPQPSRVIMPPMNQAQASMLASCTDMDRD